MAEEMPFDVADHTFNIEEELKDKKLKLCPLFITCDQPSCRYYKPLETAYTYIFCYNYWVSHNEGAKLKGGLAVSPFTIRNYISKNGLDKPLLNGQFVELVEIDEAIP